MSLTTLTLPSLARARYVAIAGTHGACQPHGFHHPDSPLSHAWRALGYFPLREDPDQCFGWTTALDGVDDQHLDWQYAGRNAYHYIVPPLAPARVIRPEDTNFVVKSHGLQVIMHACGRYGLKINGLISVGSPIRGDLLDLYEKASANIRTHIHLYSRKRDLWQIAGGLFDGRWGVHKQFPFTPYNYAVPGGHGEILDNPKLFPLWEREGWLRAFDPPREAHP